MTLKNPRTFIELRAFLLVNGLTFADIARAGGWGHTFVRSVASRYWGQEQRPRAIKSMAVLVAIEEKVRQLQESRNGANEPEQAAC